MSVKYQPAKIEPKWQAKWQQDKLYSSDLSKPNKYYVLAEFPYPSGDLHMGHWFTFSGADIFARFKRMQGFNVFFPNGFDAFGLPAEGAAIKRGIHPKDWTFDNIRRMKEEQWPTMGASFTFDHQVITCEPKYYKWNQWIFLKMFEKNLAYRGKYLSNWCPNCQTVLANEAVEAGKCWRCGTEVVQKEVEQWFLKITDYAERLLWDQSQPKPNGVDWAKSVIEGQNSWIGKSEGANLKFKIIHPSSGGENSKLAIEVFTTRLDTIYGATFLVIAPEHPLVNSLIAQDQQSLVESYLEKSRKKSELERKENKEKSGVFSGSYAINPFNNKPIPIWIADYVLPGYGTGAIMAVPAHDDRDYQFAQKFDLEIVPVVEPTDTGKDYSLSQKTLFTGDGVLIDSAEYTGMLSSDARLKMSEYIKQQNIGSVSVQYHLHDWSISRQRYWGTPIPIIHCSSCGLVPVPEDQLPIELPYDVDYQPKGKSPLASNEQWINTTCPKCHQPAKRDPDTMDTFIDSSWYFFRYLSPDLETKPFDVDISKKILPVDVYMGGAEHTLGHTLYSRFFTKFFKDLNLIDIEEYALRRINHGIILGPDGNKMSKSKGNVINPDEEVKRFGADCVRVYLAFFIPYDGVGPWNPDNVWGVYRFLERIWGLQQKLASNDPPLIPSDLYQMHKTIKKVTEDIEQVKFNTAIAALMEWLNHLSKKPKLTQREYQTLLKLLSPFAPHLSEELWQIIGQPYSIHNQSWPEFDPSYLQQESHTIAIQINGKVRDTIIIDSSDISNQTKVEEQALSSQKVKKFLDGQIPKKTIYIPGKILSFVV